MSGPLVLDIETVPTEAALALPYPEAERNPPGNYSKPDTIAAWREKDRAAWEIERIKAYSLNPRQGRILCLGYTVDDAAPLAFVAATEDRESAALRDYWTVAEQCGGRIVTWNGAWDLRFIVVRSLVNGVEPTLPSDTIRSWFRRYVVEPHCDVKALLTNWDPRDGHLNEWCQCLGIPGKSDGIDGSKVYELYRAGEFNAIANYCKQDVNATRALYLKVARMFASEAA